LRLLHRLTVSLRLHLLLRWVHTHGLLLRHRLSVTLRLTLHESAEESTSRLNIKGLTAWHGHGGTSAGLLDNNNLWLLLLLHLRGSRLSTVGSEHALEVDGARLLAFVGEVEPLVHASTGAQAR